MIGNCQVLGEHVAPLDLVSYKLQYTDSRLALVAVAPSEHAAPTDWVSYKLQCSDLVSTIELTLGDVGPPTPTVPVFF